MATINFTSSDTFMFNDTEAHRSYSVTVSDFVQCTYDMLRSGPDGDVIAFYKHNGWELLDGSRYSDWSVEVS